MLQVRQIYVLSVITDRKIYNSKLMTPDVIAYNDYFPFEGGAFKKQPVAVFSERAGMRQSVPTRYANTDSYRYGYQSLSREERFGSQEMDNEIKGVGNSINYKFRMHDPRLGRFFAVDPLAGRYPHNSPYAFSENTVINAVELEGLEHTGGEVFWDQYYQSEAWCSKSSEEQNKFLVRQGMLATGFALDVYVFKGKVTKFLGKQFAVQAGVNTFISGASWVLSGGEKKFTPKEIISETLEGFDFADAGLDQGIELVLNKYNISKIKKIVTTIAPALIDITEKDGVQIVGVNKEAENILTDILGNILTESIETKLADNKIEIPKIKLSASKEAQAISGMIMNEIQQYLDEVGERVDENKKINLNKDINEIKKDVIPQ